MRKTGVTLAAVVALAVFLPARAYAEDDADAVTNIKEVLEGRRADVARCVEKGVDVGKLVEVVLTFDITPRGRAANTLIESPDLSQAASRCIKKTVERMRFPAVCSFSQVTHKMGFLNTHQDRPVRGKAKSKSTGGATARRAAR